MDDKIKKLWFSEGKIWIATENGLQFNQPLEAFPALYLATPEEMALALS